MMKSIANQVWAFDVEWVPDPESGRRIYGLPDDMSDEDVVERMWIEGGRTEDNPQPYLKTVMCRVVSIAAVTRKFVRGELSLGIRSLPTEAGENEAEILTKFLSAVGSNKPQLVGFNSVSADIVILKQRALANSLSLPDFCKRPAKPWEGVDYFAKGSDYHIDLKDDFGNWGKGTPSLHELATVCRIPGKLETAGDDVINLWRAGKIREIVQYNECDALTTYLVWLRAALLGGHVTEEGYAAEEAALKALLAQRAKEPEHAHLSKYLEAWQKLQGTPAPR